MNLAIMKTKIGSVSLLGIALLAQATVVQAVPSPGKTMADPMTGKKPSEIYQLYVDAIRKDDFEGASKLHAGSARKPSRSAKSPQSDQDSLKELLRTDLALRPERIEIVSEKVTGLTAQIQVKGEFENPFIEEYGAHVGTIHLRKQAGIWKVAQERWTTVKPEEKGFEVEVSRP